MSFQKVAVANRGAVAARLVRTLGELGIKSLLLCSEADRDLPYVAMADESAVLGVGPPKDSYLNQEAVLELAAKAGADAVHPGWGFLAENAGFARRVAARGMTFIGPAPDILESMGHKVLAREAMARLGLPLAPSTGELAGTTAQMAAEAEKIGFPLLVKPAGGGGGIGMIPVTAREGLEKALETARSAASRGFGNESLYAERLLVNPRHVEFQIAAAPGVPARALFERDCSVQRRRQKILEEAGAPGVPRADLDTMAGRAASVMTRLGYDSLGTVETLFAPETGFYFLEVNPRLQVEHAVTEMVTGVDLVRLQILAAAGLGLEGLPPEGSLDAPRGHAVEARVYAEDSLRFLPQPGPLNVFRPPAAKSWLRVETGLAEGCAVTPFYDPMIAQVIAWGRDRAEAVSRLSGALAEFQVGGIKTNLGFLRLLLKDQAFLEGKVHTGLAEELVKRPGYKSELEALS
ncbi:MAG: biotin carboxylase [Deltaproteobacteria bacterium]|jgi:acetyl-CoA carboxylase biotin carboxylase subunit|nr:biotin carboxylase [Deltaproteobacteria bacterium]